MNPMDLKRGIDLGVAAVVKWKSRRNRRKCNLPVGGGRSRRSAPLPPMADATVGDMIARAMDKVGNEGVITVEGGPRPPRPNWTLLKACSSTADISRPYFVTNAEKMRAELDEPYILLHEKKLGNLQGIAAAPRGRGAKRQAVGSLSPRMFEGEALATLVVNSWRGRAQSCRRQRRHGGTPSVV